MRNPKDMLAYEIRMKPFLADIAKRLDEISVEEMEAIKFPLPWIRKGFIEMKKDRLYEIQMEKMRREIDDDGSRRIVCSEVIDPDGWLILWTGDDGFLKIDRGIISVASNRYLFMPMTGGVFIDHIFSRIVDPQIKQYGRPSGQSTLTAYKKIQAELRNKDCPIGAPVIDLTGNTTSSPTSHARARLAGMGVQIG